MHDRFAGPAAPSPVHVTVDELRRRIDATRAVLVREKLDALLIFGPESHYWLTGLDTGGYVFFQCGILPADGRAPILLTRRPDLAQARDTSLYGDIRIWYNAPDADPAGELAAILDEYGLARGRLGVELDTYGLTAANHLAVTRALPDATLLDGSSVIRGQRLVKSESEIAVIRRAAALADASIAAARAALRPGVPDSVLTAAALTAILEGGGDMPPAGPLCNSGRRAVYGRGVGGPRTLEAQDQVVIELAATVHRYNVCIERTLILGEMPAAQKRMAEAVEATMAAIIGACRPGAPVGAMDEAHRATLDARGFGRARFSACGYSLGATFRPSWMDVPPMIFSGNSQPLLPGMILFPHVMLGDMESGCAFGSGDTILVTDTGAEVLTRSPFL